MKQKFAGINKITSVLLILVSISACSPRYVLNSKPRKSAIMLSPTEKKEVDLDLEYQDFSDLPFVQNIDDAPSSEIPTLDSQAKEGDPQVRPSVPAAETNPGPTTNTQESRRPEPDPKRQPDLPTQRQPHPPTVQTPADPTVKKSEARKSGKIIGTVYYIPVYGEKRVCEKKDLSLVKDENEKVIATLCHDEVWNCAMQGSCFYVDKAGTSLLAYKKIIKLEVPGTKKIVSQPRFRINREVSMCPQGMGAFKVCLDPYRSVAADPKFYKMGDVIYVPVLKDKRLPNGEIHDGYLVIRDTGGNIKGEGRFDFYIGFDHYRGHLFSELGLADKNHKPELAYHLAPEEIAEKVRVARRFPLAPQRVHDMANRQIKEVLQAPEQVASIKETKAYLSVKY